MVDWANMVHMKKTIAARRLRKRTRDAREPHIIETSRDLWGAMVGSVVVSPNTCLSCPLDETWKAED